VCPGKAVDRRTPYLLMDDRETCSKVYQNKVIARKFITDSIIGGY